MNLVVTGSPERCLKRNVQSQATWRPHNVFRSATTGSIVERCFGISGLKRDEMECIRVKGCVLGQCRTIEVGSRYVGQQATHVVEETINVNHCFRAETQQKVLCQLPSSVRAIANVFLVENDKKDHQTLV